MNAQTTPTPYVDLQAYANGLAEFFARRREKAVRVLLEDVFTRSSVVWGTLHPEKLAAACKVLGVTIRDEWRADSEHLTLVRDGVPVRTLVLYRLNGGLNERYHEPQQSHL